MSDTIQNRSELLFLYDVKYANPNGDPMDVNRPRMDEDTMKCLVTDVRLKRTIRDYLDDSLTDEARNGNEIFIKEIIKEDGNTASVKDRIKDVSKTSNKTDLTELTDFILDNFIDTRLFGATYPTDKDSITLTGPVQFNIGISLHKVKEVPFDLSLVMASGEGKKSGSQAEGGKKTIKYGLIGFHGVINERAAQHTKLSDDDIDLLLKGMWLGTKELLTTSKKGHMPRLLVKVDYKPGFYIGDLLEQLTLEVKSDLEEDQIGNVTDYILQTEDLNKILEKYQDKIVSVSVKKDDRLTLGEPIFNASEFSTL